MTVIDWLLDSDPAIRWQVQRDLLDATAGEYEAERAKVATEGWGSAVLAAQRDDGSWGGGAYSPEWTSTTASLQLLRWFGIDPAHERVRRAITAVHAVRWEYDHPTFTYFEGEVEPCINGQAVAIGAYFGQDVRGIVDRLLGEQMTDGGWNCEQERGSVRGSFDSTLNVLEGFLEFERTFGEDADVAAARRRGEEYLLERRLLHRLSDGEIGQRRWLYPAFPNGWHYDIVRVLDYLRAAGVGPDARTNEAVFILGTKRGTDGKWAMEYPRHDELAVDLGEGAGEPSRWLTLKALRILRWAETAATSTPANAVPA